MLYRSFNQPHPTAIAVGLTSTFAWYTATGATATVTKGDVESVDTLSIDGPKDSGAGTFGLVFSTAVSDVTPKNNNVAKTLILSDYDESTSTWYSQTNTSGTPIVHTLADNETYYKIYKVVVTSNYSTLVDTHGELPAAIAALPSNQNEFRVTFSAKTTADDSTITHAASFWLQDNSTVGAPVTATGYDSAKQEITVANLNQPNDVFMTKYLIIYVDGSAGSHSAQ